jgi:hypothetical protein
MSHGWIAEYRGITPFAEAFKLDRAHDALVMQQTADHSA